jgi:aminoglycoside phosphotransferase family enzyme
MECERLGAAFIGDRVFDIYQQVTKDHPPEKLICFYKSCRASLRAKLAIWHLKDSQIQQQSKWIQRAKEYLQLAGDYFPL